ncbi:MAG: methylated-DNA--[protein]-cysteine S-methyltransferase [Coriobacteriia bacterium]|nr:methylated-DNA--[protein]-cysteine S-methyltransferase [Coriobacteriia bacterium]MCL2537316.1 methylated-DNA--[protein]-cysteine S-methyltransferase [Coriobacteriia bacterium]
MTNWMKKDTPIGEVYLADSDGKLSGLYFEEYRLPADRCEQQTPLLDEAARQLDEYFAGTRNSFDLPLAPAGTDFQQAVWQALCTIPYGKTCSYGDIAARIGKPKASRAVGGANNRNPIAIIIPCHRVIGSSGKLVGYGGGLPTKIHLLKLEGIETPE